MHEQATIQMRPIGLVETDVMDGDIAKRRREMLSEIVFFEEFAESLLGIREYSHIFVLFWLDRVQPSTKAVIHPRGDSALPATGILASRGRGHPNPIGLAVCELVEVKATRLLVRRLDAYNGTPVLDIKPYDHYDVFANIKVPQWLSDRSKNRIENATKSGS
ncbi:MAG: tRNA-Thr(GGU) m(6)t(6)A37 methyltransferase TsaA [Gammaproteobacteria bacterium]|jgi:tRNA-Thr(GGU) m(6)t(6)A37 methyltransferase TsaA